MIVKKQMINKNLFMINSIPMIQSLGFDQNYRIKLEYDVFISCQVDYFDQQFYFPKEMRMNDRNGG